MQEARRLAASAMLIDIALLTIEANLLIHALHAGEHPLSDHLLEQSLQTTVRIHLLATLRDLHILPTELNADKPKSVIKLCALVQKPNSQFTAHNILRKQS